MSLGHLTQGFQSSLGSYIADTLDLANNTLIPGNFPAANCQLSDIAYDTGKGEIFLACLGMTNVMVLSDNSDRVVAVVPVAGNPWALVYDHGRGEVFVGYQSANHIDAISDASNSISVSVSIGQTLSQPGLAYDSGKGEIYVAEGGGPAGNVTVISDSSNSVVTTIHGFSVASGVVYDKGKGEVFVTNFEGTNVSIVNDSLNTIVASIPVGSINALSEVYDPGKGEVFVSWINGAPSVKVISDSLNKVVANITLGWNTAGMAYDGSNGEVYVANVTTGSNNVSVISDATNRVIATLPVGPSPWAFAYDATRGEMFIASYGLDTVGLANASTNTFVSTVQLDNNPCDVAYDSGKGEVFVADYEFNAVSVIDGSTNLLTATVPVQYGPRGIAYDSGKGEVFTTDSGSNNVSVISDSSNSVVATIHVGSFPFATTYDKGKGEVFVVNQWSDNVSVISDSTDAVVANIPVGVTPYGIAYDSAKGEIFVTNWGTSNVSDPVMVINDTTNTVVATISVGPYPDGIGYDSANGELLVANQGSANVSFISDSSNQVLASAKVGVFPQGIDYDSAQGEWFVGNWGSNNVSIIRSSSQVVLGNVSVGNNPVGTVFDSGNGQVYVSDSNQGTGTVSIISPERAYTLTFSEVGLPLGTLWSVTLNGSTKTSSSANIAFAEPNGTYTFLVGSVSGYIATPSSGSVTVNSASQTVSITFSPIPPKSYAVTFSESGLPSGTNWSVTLNGATKSSTTAAIAFAEPNGTYPFTVGSVSGYTANVTSGSLTVNGGAVSRSLTFTSSAASTYTISFTEAGLPSGTSWSVNLSGTTHASTTTIVTFTETNGTYAYTVGTVSGYTASPSSGSVTVSGANLSKAIIFTKSSGPTISSFTVTPSTLGVGQTTTLSVSVSGGTGTLSYAYTGLPPGCTSSDAVSLSCIPNTAGSYAVRVYVNDTAGSSATATAPLTVTSSSASPLSSVSVTPPGVTVSLDSSQSFSALPICTNGPCPPGVSYVWGLSNSLGKLSSTISPSTVFTAGTSLGQVSLTVTATFEGTSVSGVAVITITSGNALSAVLYVYPSPVAVGSYVTFTAAPSQQLPSMSYAYTGLPTGCSSEDAQGFSCVPTASGTFTPTVSVSSSAGSATASATLVVAGTDGFPEITSFEANPDSINIGQKTTLTASVTGGTLPYSYTYTNLPSGCSTQDSSTLACSPTASGVNTVQVTVTDSSGLVAYDWVTVYVGIESSWRTDSNFNVISLTISGSSICNGLTNALISFLCEDRLGDAYLVLPSSGTSTTTFQDDLLKYFGVALPGGYTPIGTFVVSIPVIHLLNEIPLANLNLAYQSYTIDLSGVINIQGMDAKVSTTPTGNLNLALTLSLNSNAQFSDVLGLIGSLIGLMKDPTANIQNKVLSSLQAIQALTKLADLTIDVLPNDLSSAGSLAGYQVFDAASVGTGTEGTLTSVAESTLQLVSTCADDDAAVIDAVMTGGEPAGDAVVILKSAQCAMSTIDFMVDVLPDFPLTVTQSLKGNWFYQELESALDFSTSVIDPHGYTIYPSFLDGNGHLVLGYNWTNREFITQSGNGTLFALGDTYWSNLWRQGSGTTHYALELRSNGGFLPIPYFVQVLSEGQFFSDALVVTGALLGNGTLQIPLNSTAGGVPATFPALAPTATLSGSSGHYHVVLRASSTTGGMATAAEAYAVLNSTWIPMHQVSPSTFDLNLTYSSEVPTIVSLYVIAPMVPGGFAEVMIPGLVTAHNQSKGFLGLPGFEGYFVVGAIVAVVAAVAGILLMKKRAPPKPASSASKEPKERKGPEDVGSKSEVESKGGDT